MNVSGIFLIFLAYSFLGWLWETSFCSIKAHLFINRGFLFGPLCPIYGFGGVVITLVLRPWAGTWIQLFFASMIVASVLEYLTSWLLEELFHTRWWDYSRHRFNLQGRIYLGGALTFGLMGMLATHFVQPHLENFLRSMTEQEEWGVAGMLLAILLLDLAFTLRRLVHFTHQMERLHSFMDRLRREFGSQYWFVQHGHSVAEAFQAIRSQVAAGKIQAEQALLDEMEELNRKQKSLVDLARKFPTMVSHRFHAGVENLHHHARSN